ncbi:MAG: TlyA family RNA methyltransferase [Clostridia bacterium]|nr:TlyA family RNA methyltransferase [Clostridia bacterium]
MSGKTEKLRLDQLLVQKGLIESREKAKAVIMAGHVMVDGDREDKPGRMVAEDAAITVRDYEKKYVSRGGYKLEKATQVFPLSLRDAVCIDAGASTGGFTDCMLQNGAAKVYAVDVGYGQLDYRLRTDPRVVSLERTNVRHLSEEQVPEAVDFVSIDVSFISLALVLPPLAALLRDGGEMVALIKPQFEAGREKVGKKGVVRDAAVHREVVEKACRAAAENGLVTMGLDFSPIKGPEGNIEFLAHWKKGAGEGGSASPEEIEALVQRAHEALDR